ncbi:hypothetical protein C7E18_23565, partial [Stenotrophomonas maltophilia]
SSSRLHDAAPRPLPLNALRAFEAAARHQNFTRANNSIDRGRISHHSSSRLHDAAPRPLPLNALRAFEAAARHQNFTRA